jgi:glycosyltransferase involved in cell wall biosynthesis
MGGHHYNAVLRIQTELSKMHVDHVCLGSAFADDHVVQTLGVERCFTRSVYGRSNWTSREFVQSVAATGRELSRALRWTGIAPDLLLLPCCDQVLILALANYLRRPTLRRIPHIVLWLLFAPHYEKAIDDPAATALFGEYRQAFAALRASVHDDMKITVYCETRAMAEVYRAMSGLEIAVAPGPNLIRTGDAIQKRDRIEIPTVVCTGHANAPKGYRLLLGALERVLHERGDVKFMIHGAVNDADVERDTWTFETLASMRNISRG